MDGFLDDNDRYATMTATTSEDRRRNARGGTCQVNRCGDRAVAFGLCSECRRVLAERLAIKRSFTEKSS